MRKPASSIYIRNRNEEVTSTNNVLEMLHFLRVPRIADLKSPTVVGAKRKSGPNRIRVNPAFDYLQQRDISMMFIVE